MWMKRQLMESRNGIDEKQDKEIQGDTLLDSSGCETDLKLNCGTSKEELDNRKSLKQNHVKEEKSSDSPLPLSHNPLVLSPPVSRKEAKGCKSDSGCNSSNNCDRNCDRIKAGSGENTARSNARDTKVSNVNDAEVENINKKENNKNETAETGRKEKEKVGESTEEEEEDKTAETRRKDKNNLSEIAEEEIKQKSIDRKESEPAVLVLSRVKHAFEAFKRNAVLFYIENSSDNISTINESEPDFGEGDDTNDDVSISGCTFSCSNKSDRSEVEENAYGDSLDVNFDSGSVNTLSDEEEDYLCVQYSESDFLKDTKAQAKDQTDIYSNQIEENPESAEEIKENYRDIHDVSVDHLNEKTKNGIGSELKEVDEVRTEPGANELKILKCFQTRSLVKEGTESDISGFESFYSLDNSGIATSLGTPVIKRIKKTLTWTPRILSEERFSSSRSTTLSSDVASFYTAETSGTFFSARSFQLDSCDNFVTCEDFQKLEFHEEPKSKLSKAKDVLVKGRDFVRSKLDCYRKRFPNFSRSNKDIKSRILCHKTCGFSCVQVGKEISLYSIPDTQANFKGGNDIEVKGDNKTGRSIQYESDGRHTSSAGMNSDPGNCMTVRKVLEMKKGQNGTDGGHSDTVAEFECENGKCDRWQLEKTETDGQIWGDIERLQAQSQNRQERMESLSREATEETEDDLPVGTEATNINQQHRSLKEASESEESRSKKRLRWVSAIERTQGTSLTSSLTTNSRAHQKLWECVDQLLYQREMDPELLLSNLGFGGGIQSDDTLSRIPDRFLLNQSAAPGVDQYQLVMNHPELHHLLPVMGTSQLMQGSTHMMPETSHISTEKNQDVVDSASGNQEPRKGSMHRPTFSSVAHGMKFIRGASMPSPPSPDEETKRISSIPSVLDFPNRKALASQGFYGNEFASKEMKEHEESKLMKRSMSAAERRWKYHHSGKSRSNWSLTDESEESNSTGRLDTTASVDSWDRGMVLKSFSDNFSSESSVESMDSISEDRRELKKQTSISNLRKQYEDAIMKSMDGEYPVFHEDSNDGIGRSESGRKISLSDLRKQQVERLMSTIDDDGDYTAQARLTNSRDFESRSVLTLAQKSTQSTLTGSPLTPKDMNFSFEQGLQDGEREFGCTSPERPGKLSENNKQPVSIIIEEEVNPQETIQVREVNQKQNSNELLSLSLCLRSDSCNTLVPQDSNFDSETVDGDLSPRAGDALSESASSSATMSTVIHDQLDVELSDQDAMSGTLEGKLNADVRSRSLNGKHNLRPTPHPPQESFELEEISSNENALEDWNGNLSRSSFRRGTMEKSASTHSDSSGFADLDTIGEIALSSLDISKEALLTQTKATDLKTIGSAVSHDNKFTQNSSQSHPAGQQKRNGDHPLDEISETIGKGNSHVTLMNQPRHVFVCKKNVCTDKENTPALSSIRYSQDSKKPDKSLVYTLTVPVVTDKVEPVSQPSRYVSSVSFNLEPKSSDGEKYNKGQSSEVAHAGEIKFQVGSDDDISRNDENKNFGHQKSVALDQNQNYSDGGHDSCQHERTGNVSSKRVKEEILEKKRAKEALIAARSHTADWLLNSEKHLQAGTRASSFSPFKVGRPVWVSTPDLKAKRNAAHYDNSIKHMKKEGNHSFDLLLQEELETSDEHFFSGNQFEIRHSVDDLDSRQHLTDFDGRPHLADLRGDSACSSMDESVDISRPSLIGDSFGMPEDHLNYLRLARLVNGPSLIMNASKMPISKFTPNFHMKNWTHLPKRKHLEEETLLMQHAVQRYKTELCLMENMLFALYRRAETELESEDRFEVEELQHLWCEVRKEVIKMEELLAHRLKSVMAGNNAYSPLDALEIVQSMIDLLREQLYQQQMCIGRDISFIEEDMAEYDTSRSQSSVSEAWMSDISSQVSDIKSSLLSAEQKQKEEFSERISELKNSLLSEVKSELSTTQNAKMLQLQLQARDNEIQRLKMELLLQSVNAGETRKRQMLESDV